MLISFLVVGAGTLFWFGFEQAYQTPKLLMWCFLLAILRGNPPSSARSTRFYLWFLWPLASILWTRDAWLFLSAAMVWLAYGLAFSMIPLSPAAIARIRRGLAWAGMLASAYVAVQVAGWDPISFEEAFHPGGFFGNSGASAQFLLLCFCLGNLEKPRFLLLCRIWILVGIAFCQSRGVWIALLLYFFLNRERIFGAFKSLVPALYLVGLAAGTVYFYPDIQQGWHYLTHTDEYTRAFQRQPEPVEERDPWFRGKRLSILTRVILLKNATHLLAAHPVRGIGLGQFHAFYPEYARSWEDDIHMNEVYRASSSHNLLMDVSIQYGIPWLVLTLWLAAGRWRKDRLPRDYRQAVGLQLMIALFSPNFLNPAIIIPLILLYRPQNRPEMPLVKPARRVFFMLTLLVILLLALADYRAARAAATRDCRGISRLFPEHQARCLFREDELMDAWEAQTRAFLQDPYGPETLYNLGVIAWELGTRHGAFWHDVARRAFLCAWGYHPHYAPVRSRLKVLLSQGAISGEELDRAVSLREKHHRELENMLSGGGKWSSGSPRPR